MLKNTLISFVAAIIIVRLFLPACSTYSPQKFVQCFHGTKPTGNFDPKVQCRDYSYSEHWNDKNELIKTRTPIYSEGSVIHWNKYSLRDDDLLVDVMFFWFFLIFCYVELYIVWYLEPPQQNTLLMVFPFWGLTYYIMVFINNYYKMLFPSCIFS